MNVPPATTDIREGDYIRATRKADPRQTVVGRVGEVDNGRIALKPFLSLVPDNWDFEVLDRPLPPIDEELLLGAINAYRKAEFFNQPFEMQAAHVQAAYRRSFTDVINYLRQHDTYNKESK